MSLVTIPALTTIVDRQFKDDRTLCKECLDPYPFFILFILSFTKVNSFLLKIIQQLLQYLKRKKGNNWEPLTKSVFMVCFNNALGKR